MGAVQASLEEFTTLLAEIVAPDAVVLVDGSGADAPVMVLPTAVDRIGRSRRDGALLDLELTVAVTCSGTNQLDNLERLLHAMELHSRYSSGSLPDRSIDDRSERLLGLSVRIPVSLRLDEPVGPLVREPIIVTTQIGLH